MRLLLDPHALVWALGEPGKLSAESRDALTRQDAEVATSIACLWEIGIKQGLRRIDVSPAAGADEAGIDLLGLMCRTSSP